MGLSDLIISTHIIGIKELEHEIQPFLRKWQDKVRFCQSRSFGNWGGLVDKNGVTPLNPIPENRYPCLMVWYTLKILSDGTVWKCFIDPYDGSPVGDLHHQDIYQVWCGQELNNIRADMLAGNWDLYSMCQNCMVWSLFPDVWYRNPEVRVGLSIPGAQTKRVFG
jgi:hypothetical protein